MKEWNQIGLAIFAFCFLAFGNSIFSQKLKNASAKKGVIVLKGKVTYSGAPFKGEILVMGLPTGKDYFRSSSSIDGSFKIGSDIDNFYVAGLYGSFLFYYDKNNSNTGKRINAFLELPKGVIQSTFILDLAIELNDTNRCGIISWSKEKNNFVLSWNSCPSNIQNPLQKSLAVSLGENANLENIFFETNRSKLLPSSFVELNKLADYLNKNIYTTIEIRGHTDNTGKEGDNVRLSQARAKAVADYLVFKGVEILRISYKGYGSTMPIAKNDTKQNKQKNRRVEFVIKKL